MVGKKECIEIFNDIIKGVSVSFKDKLIPMLSEYLTENNIENSGEKISLIIQKPQLIQNFLPEIISYYCRKYDILSIIFNNKKILYYE